ncbi:hypothetical protein PR048_012201 [Dryococelus australis]|uniref:Integrase catalytic domain-containing protein n=1 Tax=Dryococelus australis TaxID=614101 RepID=A0ABQ9HNY2_9NEOP|nr:hypothetical protein PR048_012201 [Dryococelus australis]
MVVGRTTLRNISPAALRLHDIVNSTIYGTLDGRPQQMPRMPRKLFEIVCLDLMGHYLRTRRGKRFLVVVIDIFSRWTEACPTSGARAVNVVGVLEEQLSQVGDYRGTC